jgi:hypothetical protein
LEITSLLVQLVKTITVAIKRRDEAKIFFNIGYCFEVQCFEPELCQWFKTTIVEEGF